jgi:hypothetical protein
MSQMQKSRAALQTGRSWFIGVPKWEAEMLPPRVFTLGRLTSPGFVIAVIANAIRTTQVRTWEKCGGAGVRSTSKMEVSQEA